MRRRLYVLLAGLLLTSLLAGCVAPVAQTVQTEVTRIVEKPVEVTRIVETTVIAPAAVQEWELVNPEGAIEIEMVEVNPHPASLEDKTVGLRWNGKHNGDNFLDRIAELLEQEVKGVKVAKLWEEVPGSGSYPLTQAHFDSIAQLGLDLVIGSQAD